MYPFKEIETKWQKKWTEGSSKQDFSNSKNKYYLPIPIETTSQLLMCGIYLHGSIIVDPLG